MNEEISSDSDTESLTLKRTEEEEEEELEETAQEKKLRLAKPYLKQQGPGIPQRYPPALQHLP